MRDALARTCRGCGCSAGHPMRCCSGGCSWVLLDLPTPTGVCSACAEAVEWDPFTMATMGTEPLLNAEARGLIIGDAA